MMVEKRLGNLEKVVTEIRVSQAGMAQAVDGISEALASLVDMRAESLHIIKSQEEARADRDEIFSRLRKMEAGREGCIANQRHTSRSVGRLEVDVADLKTWRTSHVSTQRAAEQAGLQAGRFWGLIFGAMSITISLIGLYLKITGKI